MAVATINLADRPLRQQEHGADLSSAVDALIVGGDSIECDTCHAGGSSFQRSPPGATGPLCSGKPVKVLYQGAASNN